MTQGTNEIELIEKAVTGDRVAMQQLLVMHGSVILNLAEARLPESAREVIDPEDIVQQTFTQAFRSISRFRPDEGTFLAWLKGIAENKVMDAVKGLKREKRGGQWQRIRRAVATESQSAADLITLLSGGHTPSVSARKHEAIRAVQDAIEALPAEYRKAIQLRLIEGRSLEESAELMSRSPRAVQGLVDRAKKKLRATLSRLSKYE